MELRGERIVLRPLRLDELDAVFEARRRDDDLYATRPGARRRLRARIERSGRLRRGRLDLAIELDGRLVGEVDARSPDDSMPPGVFEIGITLFDRADRGRGLGADAVTTLTTYLFDALGAGRVQASTSVENVPMRTVLTRVGFVEEGVMRGFWPAEPTREDYVMYGVTKPEWGTRPGKNVAKKAGIQGGRP